MTCFGEQYADDLAFRQGEQARYFWERTASEGACVVWTACRIQTGYGQLKWNGKNERAHRVAFFLRMGRWPDGILRHLCNNPPCVLHVVEGTQSENSLDAVAAGRNLCANKTHCPSGHPYAGDNLYVTPRNGRICRECDRRASRRYRARLSAERRDDIEDAAESAVLEQEHSRRYDYATGKVTDTGDAA